MPDSGSGPSRFLLNGAPLEVEGVAPQTTLLAWLREDRQLTGTKEGCAEGDCSACTVAIAEARDDRLAWQCVNACIRLLPSVDGKAVFTVEGLRQRDGSLHPVQQAMVECHGSQCGFCTPGFVMSLFGLYKNAPAATREEVDDALSGNLCRCTGYRPILAAAQRMRELPAAAGWRAPGRAADGTRTIDPEEEQLAQQLGALAARRARRSHSAPGAATCGHAQRGLMKSGVTGEIPPMSLRPAASRAAAPSGVRFGGACTLTASSTTRCARARAKVSSPRAGRGEPAMRVPGWIGQARGARR